MALACDSYDQMNKPDTPVEEHCFPSLKALPLDISEGDVYTALKKAAEVHGHLETFCVPTPLMRCSAPIHRGSAQERGIEVSRTA